MKRITLSLAAVLSLSVLAFNAFSTSATPAAKPYHGDAKLGKEKASTFGCAGCHGGDGNSGTEANPKIAGQSSVYIYNQLALIKAGKRIVLPTMSSQVAKMSDNDMRDVALWFSSQKRGWLTADAASVKAAKNLYRVGDVKRGIPACIACHGPAGKGMSAAGYPFIGGQFASYTATRLNMYAAGAAPALAGNKQSETNVKQMSTIAAKLTAEEISALSSYISGLH